MQLKTKKEISKQKHTTHEKVWLCSSRRKQLLKDFVASNQINLYTWLSSILFSEDRHDFYHHIAFLHKNVLQASRVVKEW